MKKFFKIVLIIRYLFDRLTGFRFKIISPICSKDEYLDIFQKAKKKNLRKLRVTFLMIIIRLKLGLMNLLWLLKL